MPTGRKVDLKIGPTDVKPVHRSKKHYNQCLDHQVAELSDQQRLLYATNRHVLLIFQAMDAAAKDGAEPLG